MQKRRVIAAIAAYRSVPDFLNDFDARIRRNPFASTPEEPPEPFVRRAASRTISHLPVGRWSLGHLRLARKAKNPNWFPVDLDVSL